MILQQAATFERKSDGAIAIQCSVCFFSGFSTCHCSAPNTQSSTPNTNAGVSKSSSVAASTSSSLSFNSSNASSSRSSSKKNHAKSKVANNSSSKISPAKLKCDINFVGDPDSNPGSSSHAGSAGSTSMPEDQDFSSDFNKDEQTSAATTALRLGKDLVYFF